MNITTRKKERNSSVQLGVRTAAGMETTSNASELLAPLGHVIAMHLYAWYSAHGVSWFGTTDL